MKQSGIYRYGDFGTTSELCYNEIVSQYMLSSQGNGDENQRRTTEIGDVVG